MKLNEKTLHQLSKLSRIEIPHEKEKKLLEELNHIEKLLARLNELPISKNSPLFNPFENIPPHTRKDMPLPSLTLQQIDSLAPHFSASHFVVPQIVE